MARPGHPLRQTRHRLPRRSSSTGDHSLATAFIRHSLVVPVGPAVVVVRQHKELPVPGAVSSAVQSAADEVRHERSEEHTSELQSLMRISYAVFCLKKKKK